MAFSLSFSETALAQLKILEKMKDRQIQCKAVRKALQLLQENPRHPGLHTHEYTSLTAPSDGKVWEAYAQNQTPRAYRIFFCYYPPKSNSIYIITIAQHPD